MSTPLDTEFDVPARADRTAPWGGSDREPLSSDPDAAEAEERAREWTEALSTALDERSETIQRHRDYFDGLQPFRFASEDWEETFGERFGGIRNNWMKKVVKAKTNRMEITGIRNSPTDPTQDQDSWAIWKDNRLPVFSKLLHVDLAVTGYGYTFTWPDDDGNPRITVEDPLQTIVMRDESDRRKVLAGLKRWRDLVGHWHAKLLTPDHVWTLSGGRDRTPSTWEIEDEEENPYGRVTIVEFVNDPNIRFEGRSDLHDVESLQDLLDKFTMDAAVASEFVGYRQRVLINLEVPKDEDGNPIPKAELGVTRMLAIEGGDPDAAGGEPSIQELAASDLSNYTDIAAAVKSDIAALTDTPPDHLLGSKDNISAEAVTAGRSGLIARVREAILLSSHPWLETLDNAYLVLGLEGYAAEAELVWRNPEISTQAEMADSLIKKKGYGVPDAALWEESGLDDTTIARYKQLRAEQAIADGLSFGQTPNGASLEPDPAELAPA